MYTGVDNVKPLNDYMLFLTFENNEKRIFDMKPFLNKGLFAQLKDVNLFNSVRVSFDTVEWSNGVDMCPEILYEQSVPCSEDMVLQEKMIVAI